jgi:hypothetical protein
MVVGVDLDTVTEIRSARELGGWQPGDAWLAGRTYLFSEPQRHLTRLLDLSDMGWAPVQFTDRGAGGHAILIAPDGDDLPRAFKGNLCRCTGYRAIEDAVRGGGQRDRDQARPVSSRRSMRRDRCAKAAGATPCTRAPTVSQRGTNTSARSRRTASTSAPATRSAVTGRGKRRW